MHPRTFAERLKRAWVRPKQVMIVDSMSGKPARSLQLRPITVFGSILLFCALLLGAGIYIAPLQGIQRLVPEHVQLQRKYELIKGQLAEAEATNQLKEQQIESLGRELSEQNDKIEAQRRRLRMFEGILEARKGSGVQAIQSRAFWNGDEIGYSLILVKGGNYPRYVSGSVSMQTVDPDGKPFTLQLGETDERLPYRMESHTFLNGSVAWNETWRPDSLELVLYNRSGTELSRTHLSIEGERE